MILEFKIANFRSIHEEQTFSFVAENARRHPDNLIKRKNYRLFKAAALFGANASGKSTVIKAIEVIKALVRDSATRMNDGDKILGIDPFRLNPESRNQPSYFEIIFSSEGIVYKYGFTADAQQVYTEWLKVKSESTDKKIFEFHREWNKDKKKYSAFSNDSSEKTKNLLTVDTRENALALSVGARDNFQDILPAYRYIRNMIWIFDMSTSLDFLSAQAADECAKNEELRRKVEKLLCDADTGISSLHIETGHKPALPSFGKNAPQELQNLQNALREIASNASMDKVISYHKGADGNDVKFDFVENDSQGTNRLFALAVPFVKSLEIGAFVVIDELDASMHPLLTRKLLELFQSHAANPNSAQLLFTTHDPSLLDQQIFRRDQIWLAEKCDGASEFYSLADVEPPPRNTESFLKNYITGRYGGVPSLGPAFDNLNVGTKQ